MKTQGFTLIELLAVIVILAIIALIATPIVLGIIDDTKKSAQLRSAEMYLDGVENAVMKENMNSGGNFRPTSCTITSEGNLECPEKAGILEIEVDGEKPIDGSISFEEGKIKEVRLEYQTATIVMDVSGNLIYSEEGNDLEDGIVHNGIIPEGGVYTTKNGTVYNSGQEFPTSNEEGDIYIYGMCKYTLILPQYKTEKEFIDYYKNMLEATTDEEWQIILESEGITEEQLIKIGYEQGQIGETLSWTVSAIDETISGNCEILKTINKKDVTVIGRSGFEDTKLTSIVMPNSIVSIDARAFFNCSNLTSITIPNSVTNIKFYAFMHCTSLTSITIPNSVTVVGDRIFGFSGLKLINYMGTEEEWKSISGLSNSEIPANTTINYNYTE